MKFKLLLTLLSLSLFLSSCATRAYKDIGYLEENSDLADPPTLNIYTPRKDIREKSPVVIFVHGGNWNSGSKELYWFMGRNFAKKDMVTVIPGYTLSPNANYDIMAQQIAEAVRWTEENIDTFNGDPDRIFLTGHSAGGHLISLVATNPKYGIDPAMISGIILNDAAGLDRLNYFQKDPPSEENDYITTWTKDPEEWRNASPVYFLSESTPPFMVYRGSKTYESIKEGNARFLEELHNYQPDVNPIILDKKHIPMITQYIWPWSKRYDEIVRFMESNKK